MAGSFGICGMRRDDNVLRRYCFAVLSEAYPDATIRLPQQDNQTKPIRQLEKQHE
jgi:hypothetical protein